MAGDNLRQLHQLLAIFTGYTDDNAFLVSRHCRYPVRKRHLACVSMLFNLKLVAPMVAKLANIFAAV